MQEKHRHPEPSNVGLVANYRLWAGLTSTDSVFDYSLNGFDGTPTGTDIAPAYPGFLVNGTDDHINLSSPFQSTFRSSFTISIWVRPSDGRRAEMFLGSSDAGIINRVQIAHQNDGRIQFLFESNDIKQFESTTDVVFIEGQNPWVHVVMTGIEDTSINGYVDGELQATKSATLLTFADFTSSDNIYLGAINSDGSASQNTEGCIGDLSIYNKALSLAEIKSLYELTKWRYQNN